MSLLWNRSVHVLLLLFVATYLASQAFRCAHNDAEVVALHHRVGQLEAELDETRFAALSKPTTMRKPASIAEERAEVGWATPGRHGAEKTNGQKEKEEKRGGEAALTAISFNVLEGGRGGREQAIVAWLVAQKPDVVGLNELNDWSESRLKSAAEKWGHSYVVFGQARSGFHVALTSKYPIERAAVDAARFRHAAVSGSIKGIRFIATHLAPNSGQARLQEVAHLSTMIAKGEPTVIMGDLNSLSEVDDPVYTETHLKHIASSKKHSGRDALLNRKFSHNGRLDYRILAAFYAAGLKDLVHDSLEEPDFVIPSAAAGKKFKFSPTVPTMLDQKLDHMNLEHAMRLDYFLGTSQVATPGFCDAVRGPDTDRLSDHYPVKCIVAIK